MKKNKEIEKLNDELDCIIVDLCYLDLFSSLKELKSYDDLESSYTREFSYENGLKIKYSYCFSDYMIEEKKFYASVICQLLYDEKIPVLFFKTFVDEQDNELDSILKKYLPLKEDDLLCVAAEFFELIKVGQLGKTEFYQTSYHAAPWMREYLKIKKCEKQDALLGCDTLYQEDKQKEIERNENAWMRLEDKEYVRLELEKLLGEFKQQVVANLLEAKKEDDITKSNQGAIDLYATKMGSILESNIEKEKQKLLK